MATADRLIEVFDGARILPPGPERHAWLDAACHDDPELREQARSLLEANDEAGEFLWRSLVPARVTTEQPGDRIGRYKLLEPIGEGGCGIVYKADQEEPVRRRVALKVIKLGMDTREVVSRFEAERQALAIMDHPNIAKVFDAGATDAGRPYFVMELVPGIKLTEYCDCNHLPTEERLRLFAQVCHAIQHAHQKGIIHRDIKPSNILVAESDGVAVPKVIDFGIAKATEQRLTGKTVFTGLEQFIGTPAYMSPEQATMTSLDIDTRSDIYSLGVLLYELLTGRTPFDAGKLIELGIEEIRRTIREEEPLKPSTRLCALTQADLNSTAASRCTDPPKLLERVRGDLDWIVLKCLEKDRTRRYETANGLARDIEHYLHDEPVLASPPSAWYRMRKLMRKHKGPVVAGSLFLLALIAGVIGTTWGMFRAGEALSVANKSEREKSERLLEALTAQARATRLAGRSGQRFETLEILGQATRLAQSLGSPPAALRELRTGVTAALARPDLYFARSDVSWTPDSVALAFDSAHALCARSDLKGNCSIRRVEDDVETHSLPGIGESALPVFSQDGTFIALQHYTRDWTTALAVHIWHLSSPPRRILVESHARAAAFRGSGEVVIVYNDGHLGRFTLPDGRLLNSLPAGPFSREVSVALHPSEPLIAMASYFARVVEIRNLETGEVVKSLPETENVTSIAWHPDGSRLAVGYAETAKIRFYDRASWRTERTIKSRQAVTMLSFNDSGNWLATYGWASTVEVFEAGSESHGVATDRGAVVSQQLVWNDSRLAGGARNGSAGIWQFAYGREFRTLVREGGPDGLGYYGAALHPEGRWLAVRMTDGIGVWDLITRRQLAFVPEDVDDCHLLFEPSGSLLTLMQKGLLRWPLRADPNDPGHLIIGPPESLSTPGRHGMGQSGDGKVTVICNRSLLSQGDRAGGWIHHAGRMEAPIRIDAEADVSRIAVSPDGRWVVTATHALGDAKLWDARDGRFVRQLADRGAGSETPAFSPDGRWLSMGHNGGRVFSTETWEAGPPVGRTGVFAPDGRLIAVAVPTGVRLVEHTTGREIAMFEDPNLNSPLVNLFNKDGTKLICLDQSRGIHVWDLRLIREELKARGLDWEWPEFPPEKP